MRRVSSVTYQFILPHLPLCFAGAVSDKVDQYPWKDQRTMTVMKLERLYTDVASDMRRWFVQ